jgi:hypothetical protein
VGLKAAVRYAKTEDLPSSLVVGPLCGELFGKFVDVHRLFVRLFGEFVSGQVIFFTMRDRGCLVSMCCKIVEFRESIVRALWHRILLPDYMADLRDDSA